MLQAVHAHLPPSQRLEYLELKRKLAEKEKSMKLKTSRSSSPLSMKKPDTENDGQASKTTEHASTKTDSNSTELKSACLVKTTTAGHKDAQLPSDSLFPKKVGESLIKQQPQLTPTSLNKAQMSATTRPPAGALQVAIQPITKPVSNLSHTGKSAVSHSVSVPSIQARKASCTEKNILLPLIPSKPEEGKKTIAESQFNALAKHPKILSSGELKSISSKVNENKVIVTKKNNDPQKQPGFLGEPKRAPLEGRLEAQKLGSKNLSLVANLPKAKTKLETAALGAHQLMTLLRKELALEKSARDELARLRLQMSCVEQKRAAHATRAGILRTKIKRLLGPMKRPLVPSKNSSSAVSLHPNDARGKSPNFKCEKVKGTDSSDDKEAVLKPKGISTNSKCAPASNSNVPGGERDLDPSRKAGASASTAKTRLFFAISFLNK